MCVCVCSGEAKALFWYEQELATQYRIKTQMHEALKDGADSIEATVLHRILRRPAVATKWKLTRDTQSSYWNR